jgi:hypothetical protein
MHPLPSAILAHIMLNEKLNVFGMLGCLMCIVGSVTIVLHSPEERVLHSVKEVWHLAAQPAFMLYAILAVALIAFLIFQVSSEHGASVIFVFIGICSLAGSLSVMSCKVRMLGSTRLVVYFSYAHTVVQWYGKKCTTITRLPTKTHTGAGHCAAPHI